MLIIYKIFAFLSAISLIIIIHELCHFFAARYFGVKILRLSIGFGKPIFTWLGKDKTEYVIAPILIGGYVKMRERGATNSIVKNKIQKLLHKNKGDFDSQPLSHKITILLAGIIGNLIFALFLFWLVGIIGSQNIKPCIGNIIPNSPLSAFTLFPQDEIIAIGNTKVKTWGEIFMNTSPYLGTKQKLDITIARGSKILNFPKSLDMPTWTSGLEDNDPLTAIGLIPYHPILPAIIGDIKKNSVAVKSNLKIGDKIVALNNQKIANWDELIAYIQKHPSASLRIKLIRNAKPISIETVTDWQFGAKWQKRGFMGIKPIQRKWPEEKIRLLKYSPTNAILKASVDTWQYLKFTTILFAKLCSGKISMHVLGGPIAIWKITVLALQQGFVIYLHTLAILSTLIAVTNLLPLPGTDGAQILFCSYEAIRKKPLSINAKFLFYRLSIIFLAVLLVQTTINDLLHLFENL